MSPSSNDINPDTATKLPTSSLNSDDVILNIEGRKRMRRPYERYMQQQAMQKSLENAAADAAMVHKLHKQSENHQSSDIILLACRICLQLLTLKKFSGTTRS